MSCQFFRNVMSRPYSHHKNTARAEVEAWWAGPDQACESWPIKADLAIWEEKETEAFRQRVNRGAAVTDNLRQIMCLLIILITFLVDIQNKRTWNIFSILAAAGDSESCSRTRQHAGLLSLVTMFLKATKFCLPTGPGPLCHCTMFCHSCNLKSVKPEQTPFHTLAFLTF